MKEKNNYMFELKNGNQAVVLQIDDDQYYIEIVNPYGITIEQKYVTEDEINNLI